MLDVAGCVLRHAVPAPGWVVGCSSYAQAAHVVRQHVQGAHVQFFPSDTIESAVTHAFDTLKTCVASFGSRSAELQAAYAAFTQQAAADASAASKEGAAAMSTPRSRSSAVGQGEECKQETEEDVAAREASERRRVHPHVVGVYNELDADTRCFLAFFCPVILRHVMVQPYNHHTPVHAGPLAKFLSALIAVVSFGVLDHAQGDVVQQALRDTVGKLPASCQVIQTSPHSAQLVAMCLRGLFELDGEDRLLQALDLATNSFKRAENIVQTFVVLTRTNGVPLPTDDAIRGLAVHLFDTMANFVLSRKESDFKHVAYTELFLHRIMGDVEKVMDLRMPFREVSKMIFTARLRMGSKFLRSNLMTQRLTAIKDLKQVYDYVDTYARDMALRQQDARSWLSHSIIANWCLKENWLHELFGRRLHQEVRRLRCDGVVVVVVLLCDYDWFPPPSCLHQHFPDDHTFEFRAREPGA